MPSAISRHSGPLLCRDGAARAAVRGDCVRAGRLPEALARVKPSVVAVGTFQKLRNPSFVFRGTGFAVDDGTLIATNAHVVPEALQTDETMMVLVHVPGAAEPQPREAKAIAINREHDLALLRISGARLPSVTFGDSDAVRDGQSIASRASRSAIRSGSTRSRTAASLRRIRRSPFLRRRRVNSTRASSAASRPAPSSFSSWTPPPTPVTAAVRCTTRRPARSSASSTWES
jgi:hypothetical protein